jgi:hypothetical protein
MDLYTSFTSIQNKGLLWKLLADDGAFKSIPDNKASLVQEDFERKIKTIAIQIKPGDNLVNLDKRVITEMINDIEKYKNSIQEYNAADIAQKKQKAFQNELQNKQKEFDKFNTKPVPEKIDFSDNFDTPIGSEMDKILADQIALREKKLSMVLNSHDKETATKWIQNTGEKKIEEPVKLKIGEIVPIEKDAIVKPKKVAFVEENNDFLSLLKKKPVEAQPRIEEPRIEAPRIEASRMEASHSNEDTLSLLREILNKQNQILDILKKID